MADEKKRVSLGQRIEEDHGARVMREKIGDVGSIGDGEVVETRVEGAESADQKVLEGKILEALRSVFDPEIPLNIYDLGLIYRMRLDAANGLKVEMTLTAPGCPVAGDIVAEVKRKLEAIAEVPRVEVELVWEPMWTRERLSEAARLELGMM